MLDAARLPASDALRQVAAGLAVAAVTADSRLVRPGSLFASLPGARGAQRTCLAPPAPADQRATREPPRPRAA